MYSIGEFSVISNIPKKTLRYYDEINLFKPSCVNPINNYRQYSKSQLDQSIKIIFYKQLGISLDEIKKLIKNDDINELNITLKQRLENIEKQIESLNNQRKKIKKTIAKGMNNCTKCELATQIEKVEIGDKHIFTVTNNNEHLPLHELINKFYDELKLNNINSQSSHMIKKYFADDIENYNEIFAYVYDDNNNQKIKYVKKQMTLKIFCEDISQINLAYADMFDYAKENNLIIQSSIEHYKMINTKLSIVIYGIIENS